MSTNHAFWTVRWCLTKVQRCIGASVTTESAPFGSGRERAMWQQTRCQPPALLLQAGWQSNSGRHMHNGKSLFSKHNVQCLQVYRLVVSQQYGLSTWAQAQALLAHARGVLSQKGRAESCIPRASYQPELHLKHMGHRVLGDIDRWESVVGSCQQQQKCSA